MDNLNTTTIENQLNQSIKNLLHQPQILPHERLGFLASNIANSIIKKEASLDSPDHSDLFPDALRYKEINFVFPLNRMSNLTNESIADSLFSYIKEKFMDVILCGINSIGTAIRLLPSNELLAIIFTAYFVPNIPEASFREKFTKLSKSPNAANDLDFLITLLNNFRDVIQLPQLTLSSDAEETKVASPNMNLIASHESSFSASYAVEVFQNLLSDKNFNNIISDIWPGFIIKNLDNTILFKFWRKKDFAEYKLNLTYNSHSNHPPKLDIDKILGYAKSSSSHSQQKQRPGRKNPPANQQGGSRPGKGSDAWKDFSASQTLRQGNSNYNNSNKNRGGNTNWKRKQPYQDRQPIQSHQQQNSQFSYSTWKPQNPPQQPQQPPQMQPQNQQELIQPDIPVDSQSSSLQNQNSPWSTFNLTEYYDDKNSYRNVPVNMRYSHTKNDSKQSNRKSLNRQQQQQVEKDANTAQQEANTQQRQQESNSNSEQNKWNEIKKSLEPHSRNKDEFHKSEAKRNNQRQNDGQSTRNRQQKAPIQQTTNDSEKEIHIEEGQHSSSIWSVVTDNSPYDDSHDVRKLPPQLRRSHQQFEQEEKKKANKANQGKKEQRKPRKSPRSQNSNQEQQQNTEDQKVEEQPLSKVHNVWTNLILEYEQSKSNDKKPQKNDEVSASVSAETSQVEQQPQVPEMQAQIEENEQKLPEVNQKLEEEQKFNYEPVEQVEQPVKPAKVSIWTEISQSLTAPKPAPKPTKFEKSPRANPVQVTESEPESQPEPQQVEQEGQSHPSPNEEDSNKTEQNQEEAPDNEVEPEQEPEPEVKSLAPPQTVVSAWATIQTTKRYDDRNDYRKVPAELRRSHVQATSEQKKNQKKNAPQSQQQQQNKPQTEQSAPAPTPKSNNNDKFRFSYSPEPQQEQLQTETQQQQPQVEEQQVPIVQKSSWAVLSTVPYDDKFDMRKLPPELRRTHNPQPADKTKKDKKAKKENDRNSDRKKENKNKDGPRNLLLQNPEPQNEFHYSQENGVQNEPKNESVKQEAAPPKQTAWSAIESLDTPYDDKYHLSKIPPQLRRTHKLNEEKEKPKENGKSSRRKDPKNDQLDQRSQKNQQNLKEKKKDETKVESAIKVEPPLKKLSPWASLNIELTQQTKPNTSPKPQPQQPSQPPQYQPQEEVKAEPQQNQPQANNEVPQNAQTEVAPEEQKPEPQKESQNVENDPTPGKWKQVHQAWQFINLNTKP